MTPRVFTASANYVRNRQETNKTDNTRVFRCRTSLFCPERSATSVSTFRSHFHNNSQLNQFTNSTMGLLSIKGISVLLGAAGVAALPVEKDQGKLTSRTPLTPIELPYKLVPG